MFYRALAEPQTDKVRTDNFLVTGGLRGSWADFANGWDMLKTWQWEAAVRYNVDQRNERIGGAIDSNALRAALLDTNPATAFNPFGLKQQNNRVMNDVFATIRQDGSVTLVTEDFPQRRPV